MRGAASGLVGVGNEKTNFERKKIGSTNHSDAEPAADAEEDLVADPVSGRGVGGEEGEEAGGDAVKDATGKGEGEVVA